MDMDYNATYIYLFHFHILTGIEDGRFDLHCKYILLFLTQSGEHINKLTQILVIFVNLVTHAISISANQNKRVLMFNHGC